VCAPFIAKFQNKGKSSTCQQKDSSIDDGNSAAWRFDTGKLIMQTSRNNISNTMHLNFPFDLGGHRLKMASNTASVFDARGCTMKKSVLIFLVVVFLVPATALAQHSSKAAEAKPAGSKASKLFMKAVTISGQVSGDGRTLVSEENDIWSVSNPSVLTGHEGQQVSVKCQVQPDKNEIQIFSVKVALKEVKSASNKSDSAFRR
jgi:hypothetical protein